MIQKYIKRFLKNIRDIEKVKSFVYQTFTKNVTLKLIAAVITLTLFLLVAGESVQTSKTVPIEYVTAEDMMIVNAVPFEFEMILSGPKSVMGAVRAREFSYKINLANAGPGTSRVRINPRLLTLGRGVIVSSLMPSIIYPKLEKITTKKVPVVVLKTGRPQKGHVQSIVVEPAEVTISGPVSYIDKIVSLNTEELDLTFLTQSGEYVVKLKLPDEKITLVEPKKDHIKVKIELSR